MKNIVISPFSRPLRSGKKNAKNYPYWKEIINILRSQGYNIIQVGVEGEEDLGTGNFLKNIPFKKLKILLEQSYFWISVDNFINHFGSYINKKGVVIFGKSDPKIFGYEKNVNILKDRKYLRKDQFGIWDTEDFSEEVFLSPEKVVEIINSNF